MVDGFILDEFHEEFLLDFLEVVVEVDFEDGVGMSDFLC